MEEHLGQLVHFEVLVFDGRIDLDSELLLVGSPGTLELEREIHKDQDDEFFEVGARVGEFAPAGQTLFVSGGIQGAPAAGKEYQIRKARSSGRLRTAQSSN